MPLDPSQLLMSSKLQVRRSGWRFEIGIMLLGDQAQHLWHSITTKAVITGKENERALPVRGRVRRK